MGDNLGGGKEKSPIACAIELFRDPGRIRTPNPQSRNLIFYPVELRGQRGGEITMQNAIPATFWSRYYSAEKGDAGMPANRSRQASSPEASTVYVNDAIRQPRKSDSTAPLRTKVIAS